MWNLLALAGFIIYVSYIQVTAGQYTTFYEGCFVDNQTRALPDGIHDLRVNNSVEACSLVCYNRGPYKYVGLQYTRQCFCGDSLEQAETYGRRDESECNARCPGDRNQSCGGTWRNSIYRVNLVTTTDTELLTTRIEETTDSRESTASTKTTETLSSTLSPLFTSVRGLQALHENPTSGTTKNQATKSESGVVIGSSIAAVCVVIIIVLAVIIIIRRRNRNNNKEQPQNKLSNQTHYSYNNAYENNVDNESGEGEKTYAEYEAVDTVGHETRQSTQSVCLVYGYGSSSKTCDDHGNQAKNAAMEELYYSSIDSPPKSGDQSTEDSGEAGVYCLAEPITDDFVVADNDLYVS